MTNTHGIAHNAVDLLTDQHAEIVELLDLVRAGHGAQRAVAFDRLIRFLAAHETAEQQVVHPIVASTARGAAIVAEREPEEHEIEAEISDLRALGPNHDDFDERLAHVRKLVLAHLVAEERDEFPLIRSHLDARERHLMLDRIRFAEGFAPSRHHLRRADDGGGRTVEEVTAADVILGPFRAMAETIRDAIREEDRRREPIDGHGSTGS